MNDENLNVDGVFPESLKPVYNFVAILDLCIYFPYWMLIDFRS